MTSMRWQMIGLVVVLACPCWAWGQKERPSPDTQILVHVTAAEVDWKDEIRDDLFRDWGIVNKRSQHITRPEHKSVITVCKGKQTQKILHLLRKLGHVRLFAQPTLIALSGQTAVFQMGGQLPILLENTQEKREKPLVDFEPIGMQLSLTPTLTRQKEFQLKVKNQFGYYNKAADSFIPSFEIQTHKTLLPGKVLVLSTTFPQQKTNSETPSTLVVIVAPEIATAENVKPFLNR